jgi:CMP-N-acetylneuraminic acid synthetase
MNIVAMIPARSGTKGFPDKNIKNLCGRPLISYSIEAALKCNQINETYLNSDSKEYLNIGTELGAKPFLRSKEFACDNTSMKSVIIDFINILEGKGKKFDAVIVLYPVYPLRSSNDLDEIISIFKKLDSNRPLIGMKKPETHPYLCYKLDESNFPKSAIDFDVNIYYRRQAYPQYFQITHWACVLSTKIVHTLNNQLMNEKTYAYIISDHIPMVDIDTPLHFQYAEFLLQKRRNQ